MTEHISKGQQHRLMPSRVCRGHRNQFWALGAMANCECVEDWGRALKHLRYLWPSINGQEHSEVGEAYYAVPWRDLPHRELRVKARTSRLFSLIFGCLDSKPKVLDCAIKTTKMCSLSVFEGEERFVSTQT